MKSFGCSRILILVVLTSISCASNSPYELGRQSQEDGRYSDAIGYYDQAIDNPQDDRELYRSYFHRGEINEKEGRADRAFHDYYAAKIVSCYIERNEPSSGRYASGMIPSTYCRKWAEEKMASVSTDISPDRQAALKQDAETVLARYLE